MKYGVFYYLLLVKGTDMDMEGDKKKILYHLFFDIEKSPVAYLPASRVYRYIKDIYGSNYIRRRDVELFKRTFVRPNQVLRESRSSDRKTLSYFVHGPNLLWQADLVDLHKPKGQRGRYSFVLTVIDVFSRKADAGFRVAEAFKKIGERWGQYPVRLQTDKGKEFFNHHFQQLMKKKNIRHFYVSSKFKAAVVESFNRRFQNMFYRYRRGNPEKSVKRLTTNVVHNYNRLSHRYHGYRPIDVKGYVVNDILHKKINERQLTIAESKKRKKPFKFKIGQTVRTTKLRNVFDKGYRGIFTEEVFVVTRRFRRLPRLDINLYHLKDLNNRPIENSIYYERELQKVELPPHLLIKRVLRRSKKGKKQVSFKDFPADHSIWI